MEQRQHGGTNRPWQRRPCNYKSVQVGIGDRLSGLGRKRMVAIAGSVYV